MPFVGRSENLVLRSVSGPAVKSFPDDSIPKKTNKSSDYDRAHNLLMFYYLRNSEKLSESSRPRKRTCILCIMCKNIMSNSFEYMYRDKRPINMKGSIFKIRQMVQFNIFNLILDLTLFS